MQTLPGHPVDSHLLPTLYHLHHPMQSHTQKKVSGRAQLSGGGTIGQRGRHATFTGRHFNSWGRHSTFGGRHYDRSGRHITFEESHFTRGRNYAYYGLYHVLNMASRLPGWRFRRPAPTRATPKLTGAGTCPVCFPLGASLIPWLCNGLTGPKEPTGPKVARLFFRPAGRTTPSSWALGVTTGTQTSALLCSGSVRIWWLSIHE